MQYKEHMARLYIELTRKCNLKCGFCCRGDAQNLDASKEIIDKTLDEIKDVDIDAIRPYGGEPFLVPELFEYLIDKIIDKHIMLRKIEIFSNGTIMDARIKDAITKIVNYLKELEKEENPHYLEFVYSDLGDVADITSDLFKASKVTIMTSTYDHANDNTVDDFVKYYSTDDNSVFVIKEEEIAILDKDKLQLTLSGNAKKNYKDYIKQNDSFSKVRIPHNYFTFVDSDNDGEVYIPKGILVSANGNVFVGGSVEYERLDKESLFNIMDCNHDFIDKIIDFCFSHPIGEKARHLRETNVLLQWAKENEIRFNDSSNNDYVVCQELDKLITLTEMIGRDLHRFCPTLSPQELCTLTSATTMLHLYEQGYIEQNIKLYATYCSEFDDETIANMDASYLRGFILFLVEKDAERRKNHTTWRNPQ